MQMPPVEGRHHRWPAWLRLGLVMKPAAGKTAGVTPWQPTVVSAVAAVAVAAVAVAAVARVAVAGRDWLAVAKLTPGTSSASTPVTSRAASQRPDSRPRRGAASASGAGLVRKSRLTPGSPSGHG